MTGVFRLDMTAVKAQCNRNPAETHHSADSAADSIGLELPIEATSHLVNLSNVDLDGGMVLGSNDPVASRAEIQTYIICNGHVN